MYTTFSLFITPAVSSLPTLFLNILVHHYFHHFIFIPNFVMNLIYNLHNWSNSFFKHGKCDWGWPPGHATHVVPRDPMGTRACQAQLNAAAILKFQILLEPGALPFHAALGLNIM